MCAEHGTNNGKRKPKLYIKRTMELIEVILSKENLNRAYKKVTNIDIEQFFDKVNHDKLIQILREQVNDSTTINLIRNYLKAGVMEAGLEKAATTGVPQGGPLSDVCSNVFLDELDKEDFVSQGMTMMC